MEVLVINVDSVLDHKVWNEIELSKMVPGGIPFPMLSDRGGNIGKLYDVYDVHNGKTVRATFIIDPEGYINAAEIVNDAVGRNIDETLRIIKALQYHLATGDSIPCGWVEGKKTIVPSVAKAGQVWQEWTPDNI